MPTARQRAIPQVRNPALELSLVQAIVGSNNAGTASFRSCGPCAPDSESSGDHR